MHNIWPRRPPQTEEDTVCGTKGSSISRGFSVTKEMGKQNLWRIREKRVSSGTTGRCPPDQTERLKLRENDDSLFQHLPIRKKA